MNAKRIGVLEKVVSIRYNWLASIIHTLSKAISHTKDFIAIPIVYIMASTDQEPIAMLPRGEHDMVHATTTFRDLRYLLPHSLPYFIHLQVNTSGLEIVKNSVVIGRCRIQPEPFDNLVDQSQTEGEVRKKI